MVDRPSNAAFLSVAPAAPLEGVGWTLRVLSERDYATVVAEVADFVSMGIAVDANDVGGGEVELDADTGALTLPLPLSEARRLVDQEALWQVLEDGQVRHEWLAEDVDEDHITEDGKRTVKLAGRGTGMVLGWAPVLPEGMPTPTTLTRTFTAHPMAAWLTLLTEAQMAGYLPMVSPMFDATTDSAGAAWGPAQTLSVEAGGTLLELLTRWAEANDLAWRMLPGFRLYVWREYGNHLDGKVVFTAYRNQRQHQRKRTRREIANVVYASSGDTGIAIASDTASIGRWGKRASWVSAGGSDDASARSSVANANLTLRSDEKSSRVVTLAPDRHGRWPFADYDVHDWVTVEVLDDDTASGVVRIMGMAVKIDDTGAVEYEATLQSRFEARAIRTQRLLDALGGSSSSSATASAPIPVSAAISATRLGDLRDVALTSPASGSILRLNGSTWVDDVAALGILADVDVSSIPASGDVALMWDRAAGKWKALPPPAGGGGATPVTWTPKLSASGMATLTGWQARSGTWTAGGAYGVSETGTGQNNWCEYDTTISGARAIRAIVRLTSTGTAVGFGFTASGAWGTGSLGIGINTTQVWWDRYGSGGSTASIPGGIALNTDTDLYIVESPISAGVFSVYVNGTLIVKITAAGLVNTGRVGLYTRAETGWWRDVSIWDGALAVLLPVAP